MGDRTNRSTARTAIRVEGEAFIGKRNGARGFGTRSALLGSILRPRRFGKQDGQPRRNGRVETSCGGFLVHSGRTELVSDAEKWQEWKRKIRSGEALAKSSSIRDRSRLPPPSRSSATFRLFPFSFSPFTAALGRPTFPPTHPPTPTHTHTPHRSHPPPSE